MHVLITGAGGFVAPHIAESLRRACSPCTITMSARSGEDGRFRALDVEDATAVEVAIREIAPTHVVHLAAISSPAVARGDPDAAWRVNVGGTLNIAHSLMKHAPSGMLVFAGSGQVYGGTGKLNRALTEEDVLAPIGDYAVTKAAADLALGSLARQGLRCIRLRPFNHTGPGQTEDFVLPSFAAQIGRAERDKRNGVIRVGNLDVERDFLDVRDVADAYSKAIIASAHIPSGTILNIASGEPRSIRDLLHHLLKLSSASIEVEPDPARIRSGEMARFFGNASRARQLLNWTPRYSTDDMLRDLLTAAREAALHAGLKR